MPTKQNDSQNISSQPLISFIITIYNLPIDYISKCIKSILALSLNPQEKEIIVIDDGSYISPINDILELEENIIYVRQINMGVSSARNTGIRMSTGRYIQFVDGDDYLIQHPYEHCLDIIRYHEADIVTFEFSRQNGTKASFEFPQPISGTEYLRKNNLHGSVWCYIFNKAILGSLQFNPGVRYGEDEEFTAQLFLRATIIYKTETNAYFYRKHKNSVTNKLTHRSIVERLNDSLNVILRLQNYSFTLSELDRKALSRRIDQLTMDYIYNVIHLTGSSRHLDEAIQTLTKHELFPLPNKKYTKKYATFVKLANSKIGRKILLLGIPKIMMK